MGPGRIEGQDGERTGVEDLIRRIRAGDSAAFETLLDRYRGEIEAEIRRTLPRRLHRRVSVADVAQEASLTAFQRLPSFEYRGDASLRAWLRKIAEMKVRAAVQRHVSIAKRAVGREITREGRPETANFEGVGPSPSDDAMAAEWAEMVKGAMSTLSKDYRDVLRLALEERLPLRVVAERMGRSREAAKKLYGRALAKFTKRFEALKDVSRG